MSGWVGPPDGKSPASSAAVAVVRTQVVKHADEAANAHQIFIRPGEAVQLVKEDEIRWGGRNSHFFPSDAASPLSTGSFFSFRLIRRLRCVHHGGLEAA